jgi:hypothetical protein
MINERSRRRSDLDENVASSLDGNFTYILKKGTLTRFHKKRRTGLKVDQKELENRSFLFI